MNDPAANTTGPGFLAFVAFFILALVLWFLMRNMNSRMRRMSYRQQAAHRGDNEPQATEADLEVEDQPQGGPATADQPASDLARPDAAQGAASSDAMPADAEPEHTDAGPADAEPAGAQPPAQESSATAQTEATDEPRRQGGEQA